MNTCYNAIDRHIESGRKDQAAIIYDSPVTGVVKKITYGELLADVSLVAGMLKKAGVEKGDRVIIYMPMIPGNTVCHACLRQDRSYSFGCVWRGSRAMSGRRIDAVPSPRLFFPRHAVSSRKALLPTNRFWTKQ